MTTRKNQKAVVLNEVKECRHQQKLRREEIASLPKEEKKAAKLAYQKEKKASKAARKAEIKEMSKADKKVAKKHDKIFKKIERRPIRAVKWSLVAVFTAFIFHQATPLVGGFLYVADLPLDAYTPEGYAAREHAREVAQQIADEGIVLMKNDNNSLPLADQNINVFGVGAFEFRHGGGGSGGASGDDSITVFEGLANAGLIYNEELYDLTLDQADIGESKNWMIDVIQGMILGRNDDEPEVSYLTDDVIERARDFSQNAMIFVSSLGLEASDLEATDLRLSQNMLDLVELVAMNFDNVVIVVNSGNTMELGFLDEFDTINSALWVGTPGPYGPNALGRVLSGELNPSGRLVNTWVYDNTDHPSYINFGDFRYSDENLAFLNYEEGIFVGYRFFETFAEELVQFPFGFGLSYTEFEWDFLDYDTTGENISLQVEVTNVGDKYGKDVVQVYFSAPWQQGGVEKAAIELAGFAKTGNLAPNESEIVSIEFSKRDMASYDYQDEQAFLLEKGEYDIHVAKNIRNIVSSFVYEVDTTLVFKYDVTTGTEINNQFEVAHGDLVYLSRSDFAGTFPDIEGADFTWPAHLQGTFNSQPPIAEGSIPITGADNEIMLRDLQGLDYNDPKWQLFLDQFTLNEMDLLVTRGAYRTQPIERLGVPEMILLDGPAGIHPLFSSLTAASYPTAIVVASTWNTQLAFDWGDAVGREATAYGVHGWYAPGMNIHRSPFGGRNFEYFSEDPLLSGVMSAATTRGAQNHNILVFMKHFVLNEQEVNARLPGVSVWVNEQALREIYLRPFEITLKEGGVTGVMSSFIHIGPDWSGGNKALLQSVLREEWGFTGFVTTDAVIGGFMDVNWAIRNGNDMMLNMMITRTDVNRMNNLYRQDPIGTVNGLRNSVHNITYTMVNHTNLFE